MTELETHSKCFNVKNMSLKFVTKNKKGKVGNRELVKLDKGHNQEFNSQMQHSGV